ncbi:hypothetical protein KI440_00515 [Candidatus Saccharibacteria bacterium TM7i]|nr:hypothetical protein KI440_00515 [Candidatus Saccharibacteria bacterium TM7i]
MENSRISPQSHGAQVGLEAPTLFDDWDEQTGEFDTGQLKVIEQATEIVEQSQERTRHLLDLGGVAMLRFAEVEVGPKPAHLTVADAQRKLEAQRERDDRNDAYSEYGSREVYPFATALDAYEPWHEQTRRMIEQYQVSTMDRSDFEAMSKSHQKALSYSFFRDYERTKTLKRLIEENHGEAQNDQYLIEAFGRSHSAPELQSYARVLEGLLRDVESTGIPWAVRKVLGVPDPRQSSSAGKSYFEKMRAQALKKCMSDYAKNGPAQVVLGNSGYVVRRISK